MSSDFVGEPAARQLREMWEHKVCGFLGPGWNEAFADWIRKFGIGRIQDAVLMASVPRFSEDGERLPPDIRDVPRYAAVERADDRDPGMRDCYLVRGRMRLKFYCEEHDSEVLTLLRRALHAGVSASAMHDAVDENYTLEDCFTSIGIDRWEFRIAMGHPIVDLRPKDQVFIREEEPAWRAWDAHLRKTTGKGSPINKQGGWYFPSRLPPSDVLSKKAKRVSRD
ncbi:hypothetical protein ABIA06_002889 [Bradyrhizobium yuanmingense]|uniref:hypothetical protein n=1 Tax=Bradyrhizobium yuanmingense TaxID=108015 RepID=UPI0035156C80